MEPTEEQYLIINALDTLDLLQNGFYDESTGDWYIQTPSPVLPISIIQHDGEVVPTNWRSDL
ncbi:MAG: hypothetical protein N4J56_006150 [Chroococcidiopsis sp. SAG 2025]|uniref:hypothetical protein n=1 Tax=Chroococcidiopsis sp. SAG 2025 TaxID=171389 RepID=UPI0029374817|nr:hypothetical protein [Chroococcidiopsis sp. SAG 2025]MDV2996496.1 hypothetical protein [Chroococcidiopsis sp. SAG 2025]